MLKRILEHRLDPQYEADGTNGSAVRPCAYAGTQSLQIKQILYISAACEAVFKAAIA